MGAIAGVTGAVAVLNRSIRERSALPYDHLGGTRRPWTWRGQEIFAAEAGHGAPILLVHAIHAGASSFEFRRLFPSLARRHRVVAMDFLGCGLSAMPNIEYTPELFVDQIVDALMALFSDPVTIVASSLGAAFAIRAAGRASDRVARVVTICPSGLMGVLDGEPTTAEASLTTVLRTPILGESLYNGMVTRPAITRFLRTQAYARPSSVDEEILAHYAAVTHQLGARWVLSHFVGGLLNCNVARDLPFVDAPLLVLWGERAHAVNPASNAPEYARLAKHGELRLFAHSGMLPHEEQHELVTEEIERFMEAHLSNAVTRGDRSESSESVSS